LALPNLDLALYVHVPFCTDKCLYCDFYSVPHRTVPRSLESKVIDETLAQGRAFLDALGQDWNIRTIFMGGGTPSILARDHFGALLAAFRGTWAKEWTVEANPESLDGEFLALCAGSGVTRLSLGVQTLKDSLLSLLRRSANRASTLKGVELASSRWRGELNLDFIAGIPGQSPEDVLEDLMLVDRIRPGHVSLYQLTREEGTPLAQLVEAGTIVPNAPERDEDLWFAGRDALLQRGFGHYEVSNFALPGKECGHNLSYWRIDPYVGLGPGAVSTLPARFLSPVLGDMAARDPGAVLRLSNPKDLRSFSRGRDALWGMEVETIPPGTFLLDTLMMGLRAAPGIKRAAFLHRFGVGFDDLFPGLLEKWRNDGLAETSADRIALNAEGRLVLDSLLAQAEVALSPAAAARLAIQWP
jgi:oxygen-independent coproporphyrinogen III oxidase